MTTGILHRAPATEHEAGLAQLGLPLQLPLLQKPVGITSLTLQWQTALWHAHNSVSVPTNTSSRVQMWAFPYTQPAGSPARQRQILSLA